MQHNADQAHRPLIKELQYLDICNIINWVSVAIYQFTENANGTFGTGADSH